MTVIQASPRLRIDTRRVEWPSIVLCAAIYLGFGVVTWFNAFLPVPVVVVVGGLLLTWYASLQHEIIHGHPTPWRRFNRALATPPLMLWLPFESYRRSHLVHHCDEHLTDPLDDPESYYWTEETWRAIGPLGRLIVRIHSTLAGRLLIGPAWNIGRFLYGQAKVIRAGDRQRHRIWAWHGLHVAVVLLWVVAICHVSPMVYGLMIYLGTSVLMLRSFAEHRANLGVFERTAIVENSWFFGPLFLFNNLHAAHHERPLIPWYELPAWYKANRSRLVVDNGGLVYDGYAAVARTFLFTPHDVVIHPARQDDRA